MLGRGGKEGFNALTHDQNLRNSGFYPDYNFMIEHCPSLKMAQVIEMISSNERMMMSNIY